MKLKLPVLFYSLLITISFVSAQPIITAAGFNPQIGDNYKIQNTTFYSTSVPIVEGPDQIWDGSSLVDSGAAFTYSFISPKGLPGSDSLPLANLAIKDISSAASYSYFQITSGKWGWAGHYFKDSAIGKSHFERNSPSAPYMFYPITYNQSKTDTILDYNSWVDNGNLVSNTSKGVNTVSGVGYGTLLLPHANYNNVLCVKIQGANSLDYWFVANGIHCPLLQLTSNRTDSNNNNIRTDWTAIYYSGIPLPLEITTFTASLKNKSPLLQWQATNIFNAKGFNVQRSINGKSFENVGFVAVGNNTNYSYSDDFKLTSTVFYRLQQVDKDGSEFYSKTICIQPDYISSYSIFPNPAKDAIHISIPDGNKVAVFVYNLSGKLVFENASFTVSTVIETNKWAKGSYLIRIKDNTGWQVINMEKE